MNKILITGITGSGGSYLTEYIKNNHPNQDIHGICRWHSTTTQNNLKNLHNVNIHECDLLDLSSIIRTLQIIKPNKIFHLAAFANVKKAFDTPLSVINNNIMGTANLLEGIRLICPDTLLLMCSTSEVYGNPKFTPINEEHPIYPVNPYSVSKLTQESLALSYYKSWNLNIIVTRMFSYINPRRYDLFASSFANQIVKIERKEQKVLYHGNLNSIRTLIDVRDAMESYWIASERCKVGEIYNIGGKSPLEIGQFLNLIKTYAKVPISSIEDKKLLRPYDITLQIPDTTKFEIESGWKPKFSLNKSIEFLMDYYRQNK